MNGDNKYDTLLISQTGGVLTISLNRPEVLNAVGAGMEPELAAALTAASSDKSVRAIIIKGEGRAFCAGGDVKTMGGAAQAELPSELALKPLTSLPLFEALAQVRQPMVAAVHGYAMGLGATIALFCDVVVATDDAVFADSHVSVGLVAGDGGAVLWPLMLPMGKARYYLLTGDRLSGREAADAGMILKAVAASDLETEVAAIAERLASGPPLAVQGTRAILNKIIRERMGLLFEVGLVWEGAAFTSEDHKEASSAFVEKRSPVFHGR